MIRFIFILAEIVPILVTSIIVSSENLSVLGHRSLLLGSLLPVILEGHVWAILFGSLLPVILQGAGSQGAGSGGPKHLSFHYSL
jgi:hypothetical protein